MKKTINMKNSILTSLLFLLTITAYAQPGRRAVLGKIVARSTELSGVYIQNQNTKEAVESEKGGYFRINVQPNDTLVFSSIDFVGTQKVVSYEDMNKKIMFVPLDFVEYTLEELYIDRRVTNESLGFGTPKYRTRAERNLHRATSHERSPDATISIGIDGLINALSGRTKMLEKALAYERELKLAEDLIAVFPKEFYIEELHIPEEYITAFGFHLLQFNDVLSASVTRNGEDYVKLKYYEKVEAFLQNLPENKEKE